MLERVLSVGEAYIGKEGLTYLITYKSPILKNHVEIRYGEIKDAAEYLNKLNCTKINVYDSLFVNERDFLRQYLTRADKAKTFIGK